MSAGKQAGWLFLALISLAFSGWYFASSVNVQKLDDQTLATTADTIITELTVRQFNQDGKLIHSLQTPLLHHIPQRNMHWLKQPFIQLTESMDAPAWEIHAQEALSYDGGEKITFKKQVVMHQPEGHKSAPSTLKTEEMTYFPQKKLAFSEKKMTFEQPGTRVTSIGMKAFLNEKRVQLLSRARGLYEPKHG